MGGMSRIGALALGAKKLLKTTLQNISMFNGLWSIVILFFVAGSAAPFSLSSPHIFKLIFTKVLLLYLAQPRLWKTVMHNGYDVMGLGWLCLPVSKLYISRVCAYQTAPCK
jgi:apolipoprotein N-acyltransferase